MSQGTQLEAQAAEARALLADLAAIGTDVDEETVELTVASETTLVEAVAAAIVEAETATAAAKATAALIEVLEHRQQRQLARAARVRDRVAQAMGSLGLKRLSTAAGMVTLTAAPAHVIITDATALPRQYLRESVTYAPDKPEIRLALQRGEIVPGAELSNRADTIRVRT